MEICRPVNLDGVVVVDTRELLVEMGVDLQALERENSEAPA